MKSHLEKLIEGRDLSLQEMKDAADFCFGESATETEIAALLTALKMKGESPEEIAGLADAIRGKSTFSLAGITGAMDNCGTGGDQSYSFNISTTSAFVIAGAGVTVAKHGNRSISSKTGSADVLEHLGISLSFTAEEVEEILLDNKIAFLFAQHVHQALKPFTAVRKRLGLPTIFNDIGPLTNPVELDAQVIGVYRKDLVPTIAESLKKLGRRRAVVLHGAGGVDEATLSGENHLALLDNGEISYFTLRPEEAGLPTYPADAIRGGDARENADILLDVLKGAPGAYLDTVLLNAGIGLFTNGIAKNIQHGIELARESIQSGAALSRLQRLIDFSKKTPSEVF